MARNPRKRNVSFGVSCSHSRADDARQTDTKSFHKAHFFFFYFFSFSSRICVCVCVCAKGDNNHLSPEIVHGWRETSVTLRETWHEIGQNRNPLHLGEMFTLFGRSKLLLLLYNKSCFVVKIKKKSVEVNKKTKFGWARNCSSFFLSGACGAISQSTLWMRARGAAAADYVVCSYLFHNHYHIFSRCRDHSVSPRGEAHCQLRNYAVEPPKNKTREEGGG